MEKNWRTPPEPMAEDAIAGTLTADVVILGGGQAGTCAARAAAEQGASVIVLEQHSRARHRYNGGGQVGHINSAFLKSRGVPKTDLVEFVGDWQLRSNNRSNPGLIMQYARNCGRCFDWLIEPLTEAEKAKIEIRQMPLQGPAKVTVSGISTWVGCVLLQLHNQKKALNYAMGRSEELGARWLWETTAEYLETKGGAVTGLIARGPSGTYTRILARQGVLLASGDFSGNPDMCRELLTETVDLLPDKKWGTHGCDGLGIRLGLWAGGRLEPRPLSAMGGTYCYPGGSPQDPIGTTAALWLNSKGKRYCNEGFGDVVLSGIQGMRQPGDMLATVFDSTIWEQIKVQPPGHLSLDYAHEEDLGSLRRSIQKATGQAVDPDPRAMMGPPPEDMDGPFGGPGGPGGPDGPGGPGGPGGDIPGAVNLVAADTLEELAEKLGYSGEAAREMVRSVRHYNELCHLGRDEDFCKDPSLLFPVETPPFFGYASRKKGGNIMVTTGGLLTDADQNVLDRDFEPIPGLYATGNCCGGRFGLQYSTPVSGISISMAQTMGMVAGEHMAGLPRRAY